MDEKRRYAVMLKAYRRVSREDEHNLAVKAKAGDSAARTALVEQHLPLALALCLRARRPENPA